MLRFMSLGIHIVVHPEGDVYVIDVSGRLDASTTPLAEKKVSKLLDDAKKILVDFSDVEYLSSAGMRLLLSMTKKLLAKEGKIAFFGMQEDVYEIIQMAGFERILPIFKSKVNALNSLK
jgi:anti-anti-sigma factor